jgi:hypothetical protein
VTHPFSGLHGIIYKLLAGSIIKSPARKWFSILHLISAYFLKSPPLYL